MSTVTSFSQHYMRWTVTVVWLRFQEEAEDVCSFLFPQCGNVFAMPIVKKSKWTQFWNPCNSCLTSVHFSTEISTPFLHWCPVALEPQGLLSLLINNNEKDGISFSLYTSVRKMSNQQEPWHNIFPLPLSLLIYMLKYTQVLFSLKLKTVCFKGQSFQASSSIRAWRKTESWDYGHNVQNHVGNFYIHFHIKQCNLAQYVSFT